MKIKVGDRVKLIKKRCDMIKEHLTYCNETYSSVE